MPPDEEKRRKSIAYIMRRRKRGRKLSANSGEVVKSWAEYSEVNFKPTGAYMEHGRSLILLASCIAAASPLIILAAAQFFAVRHSEDLRHAELHPVGWVLVIAVALLSLTICLFAVAYIGVSIWRFAKHLRLYKNE